MELTQLKNILEALLLTADQPLDMRKLESLFELDEDRPSKDLLLQALQVLQEDYQGRGVELKEIASGYRMQVVPDCATWVSRLWEEKAPRYSRALLETLVLIAYRQPITRGEIEEIRGVSVSSHIVKTLTEREWVRVLGHKDVPGRPSMYGTTREFLDYFNLKTLDELPNLAELKDLDKLHPELALEQEVAAAESSDADTDSSDEKTQATENLTENKDIGENQQDQIEQAEQEEDEEAEQDVQGEQGEQGEQDEQDEQDDDKAMTDSLEKQDQPEQTPSGHIPPLKEPVTE